MKYLILGVLLISIIVLSGCSQTVVKYQCADGSFVEFANSCTAVECQKNCPELDCTACPPTIEYKDKIVEKPVEVIKYQCYDGTFETLKTKCKNPEEVKTG